MKFNVEYTLWVTVDADSLDEAVSKASNAVSNLTPTDGVSLDTSSNNYITDENGDYYEV